MKKSATNVSRDTSVRPELVEGQMQVTHPSTSSGRTGNPYIMWKENDILSNFYLSVINSIPLGAMAVNSELVIANMNPVMERIFGVRSEDFLGLPVHDLFCVLFEQQYAQELTDKLQDVLITKDSVSVEVQFNKEAGKYKCLALAVSPLISSRDIVMGLLLMFEDITERKRAEEELKKHQAHLEELVKERTTELRESEARMKAQYKGIPVPTYTWQRVGEDFVLIDYNDAAVAVTQGKIADFVGMKAREMYRDMPEIQEELSRCFAEKTSIEREMLYRLKTTDASKHLAVKYAFVAPDLVLVHTEDITERVRAHEALREHTVQLEEKNKELERFNELFVGRELRIKELRERVKELEGKVGDLQG